MGMRVETLSNWSPILATHPNSVMWFVKYWSRLGRVWNQGLEEIRCTARCRQCSRVSETNHAAGGSGAAHRPTTRSKRRAGLLHAPASGALHRTTYECLTCPRNSPLCTSCVENQFLVPSHTSLLVICGTEAILSDLAHWQPEGTVQRRLSCEGSNTKMLLWVYFIYQPANAPTPYQPLINFFSFPFSFLSFPSFSFSSLSFSFFSFYFFFLFFLSPLCSIRRFGCIGLPVPTLGSAYSEIHHLQTS